MISWRRLDTADFPLVAEWLSHPHVHRWWFHEHSTQAVERDFGAAARGEEPGEDWLVLLDGEPLGLMQRCVIADYAEDFAALSAVVPTPATAASLDYLIGDAGMTGRGLGPRMIRWAVRRTWSDYPATDAILIPVAAGNRASWRALEKAGAVRVCSADMEPDNPVDPPLHHIYRFDRP